MSTAQLTLATERLARIESDPTLRFTAVRWIAHENAYPGSGALEHAEHYSDRDRAKLAEVETLLTELEAKAPGDNATDYVRWLRDELQEVC